MSRDIFPQTFPGIILLVLAWIGTAAMAGMLDPLAGAGDRLTETDGAGREAAPSGDLQAGWQVFYLNPPEHPGSGGSGTFQGQHAGYVRVGSSACLEAVPRAAVWDGITSDWVDLHPAGAQYSAVYETSGSQQFGIVRWEGDIHFHAVLWNGTAGSVMDLHPAGATESYGIAIAGDQQVGAVLDGAPAHAALWHGVPGEWIDLNPLGSERSTAHDTNGVQQVGSVNFDYIYGPDQASLWSGSAASWVDLHPPGIEDHSAAFGISPDGTQQVGHVKVESGSSSEYHAALWYGTPESWVDLDPPGAIQSTARATDGVHQVGSAHVGYNLCASFWTGTAESWENLHSMLTPEHTMSEAEDIYTDAAGIWVFGYAHKTGVQCDQAILWFLPSLVAADLACSPDSGTVPFQTLMTVTLTNNDTAGARRIAGRIDVTLGNGSHYSNWRAGFTNVAAGEVFTRQWNQSIPASGALVGSNVFHLDAMDVTPYPFNQPPYLPAGDTDTSGCTVVGTAP